MKLNENFKRFGYCLYQVIYKTPLPGQSSEHVLMTFKTLYSGDGLCLTYFFHHYWDNVEKERLLNSSLLDVSSIDCLIYHGTNYLGKVEFSHAFTLYNSMWKDANNDFKSLDNFLRHPPFFRNKRYEQLSLFEGYWGL